MQMWLFKGLSLGDVHIFQIPKLNHSLNPLSPTYWTGWLRSIWISERQMVEKAGRLQLRRSRKLGRQANVHQVGSLHQVPIWDHLHQQPLRLGRSGWSLTWIEYNPVAADVLIY